MPEPKEKKEISVVIVKPPVKITLPINGKMVEVDMSEEDAKKLRDALLTQYPAESATSMMIAPMDMYHHGYHQMREEIHYAERRGYERGYDEARRCYAGRSRCCHY